MLGGSLGRTSATGDGVAISVREALKLRGIDPKKATVAIQGFGKVGYWAAVALEKQGLKVVAVSDVNGGVTGFKNVAEVKAHLDKTGSVVGVPGTSPLSNTELLHLDVDVLVPAALADSITEQVLPEFKPRLLWKGQMRQLLHKVMRL